MPRPRSIIRNIPLRIQVREDLYAKATLALYSEVHGRVPLGDWSKLFNGLLEKAIEEQRARETSPKES